MLLSEEIQFLSKNFPLLAMANLLVWDFAVCRLKSPYSCFTFHFCFLVIFVLLIFVVSLLILVAVISLPGHIFILSSSRCIDVLNADKSSSSFFYSLSILSLACKVLCFTVSFLVTWSICRSSSLSHFKNGPEYHMRWTAQVFDEISAI